ncbi:MAG: hypothetical protein ACHQ0Y_14645 [Thermodesulfovibrionales bacterium]
MLLPAMAGYTFLSRERALSRPERLVFSYTIGTGLLSFYLFLLLLLGIRISLLSSAPFFVPFLAYGIYRVKDVSGSLRFSLRSPLAGLSLVQQTVFLCCFLLIAWKLLFLLFMIVSGPTIFWDAYTLWNYKAKVIYQGSRAELFGGPYAHYPLHLSLMRAWIATFLGGWNEAFVNLHSLLLFLCLLVLEYEFLKREAGKMTAMIMTFVLSAIPVLIYNVLSGYADMAVGYYFLTAAIMLFYWQRTGKNSFLVYSGILSSIAMFTKNEGIAIVFPVLLLTFFGHLLFAGRSWKSTVAPAALFLISSVAILLWLGSSGALSAIVTISGIKEAPFTFHPEGLAPLVTHLLIFRSFNLFWFGVILLFALNWKRAFRAETRFFLIPSILSFCAILFVFLFTPNVQWLINGTTINRTMLIVIPLLNLTTGLLLVPEAKSDVSAAG